MSKIPYHTAPTEIDLTPGNYIFMYNDGDVKPFVNNEPRKCMTYRGYVIDVPRYSNDYIELVVKFIDKYASTPILAEIYNTKYGL